MAIAKHTLTVGGVVAHVEGDYVPDENVEANGWTEDDVDPGYPASAQNLEARHAAEQDEALPVEVPAEAPKQSAPRQNAPVNPEPKA